MQPYPPPVPPGPRYPPPPRPVKKSGVLLPLLLGAGGGLFIVAVISIVLLIVSTTTYDGVGTREAPDVVAEQRPAPSETPEDTEAFLQYVVDDIQTYWEETFQEAGLEYQPTRLVIFDRRVTTACGSANSSVGPFYCPADTLIYLDLDFFEALETQYEAPGDFAQAYVVAHEFGHHIQNLLGVAGEVEEYSSRNEDEANALSVRVELQADCYAGTWGASTVEAGILEPGDLEEGLTAAAAVGDDALTEEAGRRVDPDDFTHGSAEERQDWFYHGFQTGQPSRCDTFQNAEPT